MNILILGIYAWMVSSFYTLQFQDTNGNTISMNTFQGKKVLIVNIATDCNRKDQIAGLQSLQQQYHDSLVVIVFPSNSFGHESKSDSAIKDFCESNYHTTFIIAAKDTVLGTGIHPVFNWLSNISENNSMNAPVAGDFQKFLIDKNGKLVAIMSPKLYPTDSTVKSAITKTY
jgi:glutathione peroxidase